MVFETNFRYVITDATESKSGYSFTITVTSNLGRELIEREFDVEYKNNSLIQKDMVTFVTNADGKRRRVSGDYGENTYELPDRVAQHIHELPPDNIERATTAIATALVEMCKHNFGAPFTGRSPRIPGPQKKVLNWPTN